jgi:acyl-CoA synthetase (AMP-forming)/AMP-acid ligase II
MIAPDTLPARISDIPRRIAARTPAAPALVEAGRSWSYAELVRRIDEDARLLCELDVRAGDRVMIVGENSVAQVALILACASIDAWAVNVNARLTAPELASIREHSGARRVIYTSAVSPEAAAHAARDGAQALGGELMAGPLNRSCEPEPVEPGGAQVAALIYTTGTTGRPKGVMLSHRNLLFVAATSSTLRGLTPADRAYGVLPVSHVYGLTSVLLGTLYAGGCLHLAPKFSAEAMLDAIRAGGLTIVQGVPAMYARLLELTDGAARPLASKLRFCYAGGSPLDPVLKREVEALLGLPLHNGYGLTESAPTVSQTRLDAPRGDTSVGVPIPGVDVRVVDARGEDVPPGEPGELLVRGPNVMKGYYRESALTQAALRPGGWLVTGDMARMDADGALFIVGRTKELIIRSGFNIYPLEVETVLNAHPSVTQSAVVGRATGGGDEEVVAFVEPAAGGQLDLDELHAWLAARLAPYKRPSEIVVMARLPAAPTGKVLKSELKAMAAERSALPAQARRSREGGNPC